MQLSVDGGLVSACLHRRCLITVPPYLALLLGICCVSVLALVCV